MVAGLLGSVMACRSARPLRGRICASYPGGSSMARPVGIIWGTPGASITCSTARRSRPASSAGPCAYSGRKASSRRRLIRSFIEFDNSVISMPDRPKRVITVSPMPPEKSAYALARYSRSPDSIRQSIEWVRTHDSQKFLESFYFQYGHASIADLGHTVLCFEGLSELAASESEDETLWDGQAKSSRYQDFSRSGFITPAELTGADAARYHEAGQDLLAAYNGVSARVFDFLCEKLPRPDDMKPEAYKRNIAARAFDVARYLLFWGVPTNVGQVTSIRTLEKQIKRLRVSEYEEVRSLGDEIAAACAAEPDCVWDETGREPLAPTLARHAEPDEYLRNSRADLKLWTEQNLPPAAGLDRKSVV